MREKWYAPITDPKFIEEAIEKLGPPEEIKKGDLQEKFRQLRQSLLTYSNDLRDAVFGKGKALDFSMFIRQFPAITTFASAARVTKLGELEKTKSKLTDLMNKVQEGKD